MEKLKSLDKVQVAKEYFAPVFNENEQEEVKERGQREMKALK